MEESKAKAPSIIIKIGGSQRETISRPSHKTETKANQARLAYGLPRRNYEET